MATNVTLNGVTYTIPAEGDSGWATNLSNYFIALGSATLQKNGGAFTLTSEVDFGANFGLKVASLKSQNTNPAGTGILRLGNAESVSWRNAANTSDLSLSVNSSNLLQFNGITLLSSGSGLIANSDVSASAAIAYSKLALSNSIVNADINSAAAIAYSKLNLAGSVVNADVSASAAIALSKLAALSTSKALVSDVSGVISASSVTATELGFLSGVSSSIQNQLTTNAGNISTNTTNIGTLTTTVGTPSSTNSINQIVKRDGSGNFAAGTITANLTGNVSGTAANITGVAAIANGGTGASTASAAFDALSPNTTKGDITVRTASGNVRLPVGADGTVLSADSTQTSGLKYVSTLSNPMTTAGDIIIGGTAGAATRLPAGSNGSFLTMASGAPAWGAAVPSGAVSMFAGSTAPSGWLLCDGSAVSRTTYSSLFAIVGTTYGAGDGSTTFNIPDTRGIFVRGAGSQIISSVTYTGSLAAKQGDQMQGHYHGQTGAFGIVTGAVAGVGSSGNQGNGSSSNAAITGPISDGTNGTPRTGTETRPANIALNYIIKT